ncbi:hypothetical protein [Dinghuibacter silviterrae]|uniref:Uncharacterized protein n=1 Tax=Dinghuibacter silviterrae TaxID=1539049 RepID=A0A4R8DSA4_9BACT|nr:hypothetical protein [Dinghuibacter silviterrae]TDX00736.1 hypothetical protein EDB95_1763 [Dinghuibacter silviterrae]
MDLKKYYELARRIQEQGGPGKAPALIAQAEDLEDNILAQYGLPPSRRFVRILHSMHRHKKLSEQMLDKVRERLKEAAEDYLLSSPLPDEQVLSEAKRRHLSALDVLPELGMPTQEYLVFVYNHFCTRRGVHVPQVIQEFRLLKEHRILQDIAELKEAGGRRNNPLYRQLKAHGLQFLDAFLKKQKETDPTNRQEMERQLKQLMNMAASSYLQYLQLRSHGMKDAQARRHVGLEDEVFYRIALYTFMLQK